MSWGKKVAEKTTLSEMDQLARDVFLKEIAQDGHSINVHTKIAPGKYWKVHFNMNPDGTWKWADEPSGY